MTVTTHDFEGFTSGNSVADGVGNDGITGAPNYASGLNGSNTALELLMTGDGVVFNLPVGDWSFQARVRGDFQITTGAYRAITIRTATSAWVTQMRLHRAPRIDVADNTGLLVEDGGTDWVAGTEYLLEATYDSVAETVTWKERSADGTLVHTYAAYDCSHVSVPTHFLLGGGNSGAGDNTMTFDDAVIVDEKDYDFSPPASGVNQVAEVVGQTTASLINTSPAQRGAQVASQVSVSLDKPPPGQRLYEFHVQTIVALSTGPTWWVWDGAQEIPATATVWDGAQEIAVGSVEVT